MITEISNFLYKVLAQVLYSVKTNIFSMILFFSVLVIIIQLLMYFICRDCFFQET